MWTRALEELGLDIEDVDDPYQQKLGVAFGLPRSVEELLALTVVSERRGVSSYEEHLAMDGNPLVVERSLRAILKDERWHVDWISQELMSRAASGVDVDALMAARRRRRPDSCRRDPIRHHLVGLTDGASTSRSRSPSVRIGAWLRGRTTRSW